MSLNIALFFALTFGLFQCLHAFGPPYPVTGSWFKRRFTLAEWNSTLREFSKQGGDTVLLRAPALTEVHYHEFAQDPDFKMCNHLVVIVDNNNIRRYPCILLQWCGSNFRENPINENRDCYNEAIRDLRIFNITVSALLLYQYDEDYEPSAIIQCPQYDKKIVSDRTYYRLVLPLTEQSDPCNLNGTSVAVLFTVFSGIDPHEYLLQTASEYNMSVYFGIPLPPVWYKNGQLFNVSYVPAYFEFVRRILIDHKMRFSFSNSSEEINLYNTVKGYIWSDDFLLTDVNRTILPTNATFLDLFERLANSVHGNKKSFGISSYVKSNKMEGSLSLDDNIAAFKNLVTGCDVDVISVKDGRGSGYNALFWETQTHSKIEVTDPGLYQILEYYYPSVMHNRIVKTFEYFYSFSIYELFDMLAATRDDLEKSGRKVDLWLNIEAYDALHDDPCLPVDTAHSAMDRLMKSVSKSRLDKVLTHAGTAVQKVVAFAWDPGFTCKTKERSSSLRDQIYTDASRPIIAHCQFHSSFNRSVVVIGYNLDGLTQSFTIEWPNVNGHRVTSQVYGYYFELDWGIQHKRIPSLMYIQMYDPYNIVELAPKGYVKVTAAGAFHGCAFKYDFTRERLRKSSDEEKAKKHYRIQHKPLYRVYGQDEPFL